MSYRIERSETLPAAVRRVAVEEIDLARADLSGPDVDAAVHAVRKRFKRLRALLRLVGEPERGVPFRDAGRALAAARDRRVVADTAARLAERSEALARVAARLARRASDGPPMDRHVLDALDEPLGRLRVDVAEIGGSLDASSTDDALRSAVRASQAAGRRRFAVARTWPTAVHLHEWRKRVKDLWYQATLLAERAPGAAARIDDLDVLGDTLGLDHDHAVLHDVVGDPAVCPEADRAVVRVVIAAERLRLQEQAWPLGYALYTPEPDAFVADLFG